MIKDVAGATAFITGAASGIGLGMAQAFAEAGMKVAIADADGEALGRAAAELRSTGAAVHAEVMDVTDRQAWRTAGERVDQALGPVRLLCNNAGVSAIGLTVEAIAPEYWDKVIGINLTGVFNGVHAFVARMREAGGGHIVNTASLAGLSATAPGTGAYAASKFGVVGLSEVLQAELAPSGVGVSVLCPGQVRTQLWRTSRRFRGLPDIEVPPPEALVGSASPQGLDPLLVGRRVLEAVRAGKFYILTHPEARAAVTARHERLIAAFDKAAGAASSD